MRKTSIISSL